MIESRRLHAPDRIAPVALLEDEDDDAVGGAERDEVQEHRLQRQDDRAERAHQQQVRQDQHEEHDVRELPVDGLDEVALLGPDAGERQLAPPPALELGQDVVLEPARSSSSRRASASLGRTPRRARCRLSATPSAPPRRRCPSSPRPSARRRSSTAASRRARRGPRTAAARPPACPRRRSRRGPRARRPSPARASSTASLGLMLERRDETRRDDRDAGERTRPLRRITSAAPAPPDPGLGRMRLDEPLRHHAQPVDPRPEDGEHRRQQRDRRAARRPPG